MLHLAFPAFVKSILFKEASNGSNPGLAAGVRHWKSFSEINCAGTTVRPNLHDKPYTFLTAAPSTVTMVPARVDGPTDGEML